MRKEMDSTWDEKFDALPGYLSEVVRKNPGSIVDCQVNDDGEFDKLFVLVDAVVELIYKCGRCALRRRCSGASAVRGGCTPGAHCARPRPGLLPFCPDWRPRLAAPLGRNMPARAPLFRRGKGWIWLSFGPN